MRARKLIGQNKDWEITYEVQQQAKQTKVGEFCLIFFQST